MATQTLWPALDSHGVSIPQFAEDGVTAITSAGIIVTLVQEVVGGALVLPEFYRDRVYVMGLLLTSDPLALSGDAVSVPSVTRVSASLVGVVTTSLATKYVQSTGDVVETSGYATPGDGGGDKFTGTIGGTGADGYWTLAAPNGTWKRSESVKNSEINVNKFGILPDSSDYSTAFQALVNFVSPATTADSNRVHTFYFPSGRYVLKNIAPLPGYQHELRIRGDGTFGGADVYGASTWTLYDRSGGTILYGAGSDVFLLHNDSPGDLTKYRFINLRDLSVITTGTGICINSVIDGGVSDATAGGYQLENVMLGGAAKGAVLSSYTCCLFKQVRVWGCSVGLQLGDATHGALQPAVFECCDIRLNGVGVDWVHAGDVKFVGGLIQSNTYHHRFLSACQLSQGCSVENVYHEGGGFLTQAGCNPGSIEFRNLNFGDLASITFYGLGWKFTQCSLPNITVDGTAPGGSVDISGGSVGTITRTNGGFVLLNQSVNAGQRHVGSKTYNWGSTLSGTITPDINQGSVHTGVMTGNVTLAMPTEAPPGMDLSIVLFEDGVGGRTIAHSGSVLGTINNAGNAAGKRNALCYKNFGISNGAPSWLLVCQSGFM